MSGSSFTDPDGVILGVEACDDEPGCVHIGVGMETACAGPDDFPAITAALYEAAGLPAPILLDRPGATFRDGVSRAGRIEVGRVGGRVTVGPHGIQPEGIEPAVARRLAALIAIAAGEAESEPDPAEVEEVAAAIRAALRPPGDPARPVESDRIAARAALRWMAGRQPPGGAR